MKKLFHFLTSRIFFINLAIACLVLTLFFVLVYNRLNSYTHHGDTVTVPDLRGLPISGVEKFLSGKALRYKISDSTLYDINKPPGTVIEQDPPPLEKVKENRTIYIAITRTLAPQIKMPNLIDVSFRQAEAILVTYGLKPGKTIYKPDLCKNCVLSMQLDGKLLQPGDEIKKGSVIDFVLGDGFGNTRVNVPDLVGLTYEEALFVLKASSLNAGAIMCDHSVRDTMSSVVYKQIPAADNSGVISQGEAVDLFLTQSKYVIEKYLPKKDD
ncbi:MAG: PASTA domain-containing protein [Bacteroidia bacterium]